MKKNEFIPPDGGWAWIIMSAYALNNLIFIPTIQCFGLIFRKTFAELGLTATDGSIIITSNAAFGLLMGILNGPLLKRFTFRQVALAGTIMVTGGIITTAFATKFEHIFIAYGLVTSLGFGICMASYSLALNTYFLKNRGKAFAFAFTISSIGAICAPQLISYLLSVYTVHGTVLIMGAITSHGFLAAMLLQPVKWHVKKQVETTEEENLIEEDKAENLNSSMVKTKSPSNPLLNNYQDANVPKTACDRESLQEKRISLEKEEEVGGLGKTQHKWWSSVQSLNSVHLGSSLQIFDEKLTQDENEKKDNEIKRSSYISLVFNPNIIPIRPQEKTKLATCWDSVVEFFDLTLLKDVIYVNILFGISIAVFAELNFALLTPFILSDIGFNTHKIAAFMSVLSTADLCCRFITPFVGDYFNKSARIMYMLSLAVLIVGRSLLMMFSGYLQLLFVATLLGLTKGWRTVYMALIIPSHVPLDRLASASGFQMVLNGILMLAGGPFLGMLRDNTGSYYQSVLIMNIMTALTIVLWSIEMVYVKFKGSEKLEENVENG